MMQTLNILAMLRYDKEGEKQLKGPAKRTGSSRTSNWRRYGPKKIRANCRCKASHHIFFVNKQYHK
ncbi:hypothetical protein V1523DRAFT_406404 [Lipomyces doorenjongii]